MRRAFKTFLFFLVCPFLASAHTYRIGPNGVEIQSAPQEVYRDFATALPRALLAFGVDGLLRTESGSPIGLSDLVSEIGGKIYYQNRDRMLVERGSGGVDFCRDAANARWLTVHDRHSRTGRSAMVFYMQDPSALSAEENQVLLFHESIGALGLVDDAYQVSAPLYWLVQQLRRGGNLRELLASPILSGLVRVKTRRYAPRFRVDEEGSCLKKEAGGRLSRVAGGGGVIGGGGGGNYAGFLLKYQLLAGARDWWSQNHRRFGLSDENHFIRKLLSVGIEPYAPPDGELLQIGNYLWRQGHYVAVKIRYSPLLDGPSYMVPRPLLDGSSERTGRYREAMRSVREIMYRKLEKLPQGPANRPLLIRWSSEVLGED